MGVHVQRVGEDMRGLIVAGKYSRDIDRAGQIDLRRILLRNGPVRARLPLTARGVPEAHMDGGEIDRLLSGSCCTWRACRVYMGRPSAPVSTTVASVAE